jgi:hypothetical protein
MGASRTNKVQRKNWHLIGENSRQPFQSPKQANRNFYKVEKWTRDGMKVDSLLYAR